MGALCMHFQVMRMYMVPLFMHIVVLRVLKPLLCVHFFVLSMRISRLRVHRPPLCTYMFLLNMHFGPMSVHEMIMRGGPLGQKRAESARNQAEIIFISA